MTAWLNGCSEQMVRDAVGAVWPHLTLGRLDMSSVHPDARGHHAAAAVLDDAGHAIKFAWSEEAANDLLREAAVLETLAGVLPTPSLIAHSRQPVLLITARVEGKPLTASDPALGDAGVRDRIATQLGTSLARLHQPEMRVNLAGLISLPAALAQATPAAILDGLHPWVETRQWPLVARWCAWCEEVLARDPPEPVAVHADLHGYNQIWSTDLLELRAILDWASTSLGQAEFDLRYLPDQIDGHPEFVVNVAAEYEAAGGRRLDLTRVAAWHVLTVLGDALWRSQARAPLPDGGTPIEWVDRLAQRLEDLQIPAH